MQAQYNFASDSEEDEDDNLDEGLKDKVGSYQLQDIERLKEQTKELLDPAWKETRNRHLLHKMLELEQPTITAKMVDFLLQDKVCELLVNFVTQSTSLSPRPAPDEVHGEAMKLAYRAVLLLAPESVSDPLNAFLGRKSQTIARKILEVYTLFRSLCYLSWRCS
ncbi:hypothetical protein EON64_20975 [archaeon]|nr:MAG: hypothetical protein EON64_20975 [archaeon]